MRKIFAALLVLALVASSAALAEVAWMDYDFGDFTISFPEDIICSIDDQIVNNQPFAYFFQDYDETAAVNKNLNILWSEEVMDLATVEPTAYAQQILNLTVATYQQMGLTVTNPALLIADFDEQDGKPALCYMYSVTLDYSGLGLDAQATLYILQGMVPDEAFEGTYAFTLTTDDLQNCQLLMDIMDTVSWNV